ncbi:MAG: CARDB domain-containing protein [Thermoplasmata archaeon]|nr:CARDB domain-containing protein [Thermoplasmata archaeon]
MEKIQIEKIGAIAIVSMIFLSGMMVLPTTVEAQQGLPDLVVKNIGWRFPVMEDEVLLGTVYIENTGTASVEDGFWINVNYATLPGFWQEATESLQLWVEPPIRAGEIKAVAFTTTALTTHQTNFDVDLDIFNNIVESDEDNNQMHACLIAVGGAPGSSLRVPIYLRNEMLMAQTFTVEVDETTIPDGWGFEGGLPPTTITAAPGGNVMLSESITIPADTIENPIFRLNAMRHSDNQLQSIFIKVLTTPEIGFSFNPYTKIFTAWGVDHLQQSDFTISSTILSQEGYKTVEEFTVTNDRGQYVRATLEIVSTKHLHMYEILEINYNGVTTIIPEENRFLTMFNVDKNGQLQRFSQSMNYAPEIYTFTRYDGKYDQTIMEYKNLEEKLTVTFDGFDALGVRIENQNILSIRLDTSDTSVPLCVNFSCFAGGDCNAIMQ